MGDEIRAEAKPSTGRITLWITTLSGVITILLTIVNAVTSYRIKERENALKALELQLETRSKDVEQQKANVERYQWVYSHFTDIENSNPRKRNFITSLIRLALSKDEAEQLFNSLQNSGDTLLQTVGQNGISNINSEPIASLVGQMDAGTSNARINAFNELKNKYRSSSIAIDMVLNLYSPDRINSLSPNGIINGLYFLGSTETDAWTPPQIIQGHKVLTDLSKERNGQKTKNAIAFFQTKIKNLTPVLSAKQ